MKFDTDGQVGDVLEGYIKKIEKLSREKAEEYEKSRHLLVSMDKLTEAMVRLEYQKRREKVMAGKISRAYSYLERGQSTEGETYKAKSVSDAIVGILNGAKTTGQIIEIVANSIQVMIETVSGVVKSQGAGSRTHSSTGEIKGLDLASLLKPVNAILNSLTSKQQTPVQSEAAKSSEARTEAKAQVEKKDGKATVPVVRAVSLDEGISGENM